MTRPEEGERSFGAKLACLIKTVHPLDRDPYSYREIAAGSADHAGAMTAAHIKQLVKGRASMGPGREGRNQIHEFQAWMVRARQPQWGPAARAGIRTTRAM